MNIKPFENFLHFQNLRKAGAKYIQNKLLVVLYLYQDMKNTTHRWTVAWGGLHSSKKSSTFQLLNYVSGFLNPYKSLFIQLHSFTFCLSLTVPKDVNASGPLSSQRQAKKPRLKRKGSSNKSSFQHRFVPADPLKNAPLAVTKAPEEEGGICKFSIWYFTIEEFHRKML